MHARQQIFAHVAGLLNGVAQKVTVQSPFEVERSLRTHIEIGYSSDDKDIERISTEREVSALDMEIVITAVAFDGETSGAEADSIALEVERVLSAPKSRADGSLQRDGVHDIGGARVDIDHRSTSFENSSLQDHNVTRLVLSYTVSYTHEPGDPGVLL